LEAKPADSAKTANLKNVSSNGEKVGTFDLSILDQKEAYNRFMQENPTAEVFEIGTEPALTSRNFARAFTKQGK
jgi:hypothetical protein